MGTINPNTLNYLRDRKCGLTLDALAEKSMVNRSTISRIERGKITRPSQNTIERLSKALGCNAEKLASPIETDDKDEGSILTRRRSAPGLKMSNAAQNALELVSWRYGVLPEEILDFAPLLFDIAAVESLIERRARLNALKERRSAVDELSQEFPHLSDRLFNLATDADEIEWLEDQSIRSLDIKGEKIAEAGFDPEPGFGEMGHYNPFMLFLRARAQQIADKVPQWRGEVSDWDYSGPDYVICENEAAACANDDQEIVDGIINGRAKLTGLPTSLLGEDRVAERLGWFREQIEAEKARFREQFPALANLSFDLPDDAGREGGE